MVKNLREELSNDAQNEIDTKSNVKSIDLPGDLSNVVAQITREFEFDKHVSEADRMAPKDFLDLIKYKKITADAIDGKQFALTKLGIYLGTFSGGTNEEEVLAARGRILQQDLAGFGKPGVQWELMTDVRGFPWADMEKSYHILTLSSWARLPGRQPAPRRGGKTVTDKTAADDIDVKPMQSWQSWQREEACKCLYGNSNVSEIRAAPEDSDDEAGEKVRRLRFDGKWETSEVVWEGELVAEFPGALGMVLGGCKKLHKLTLK
mmetsp:Transcript_47757/g.126652  ORF Transcript_47757/g.126652 Transcript_47757/m.126652 type:complete len:263 (-) Transcript_47757:210-998(-)